MYTPLTGNAMVVNFLMRWPVLVPVAAAVGITTAVVPQDEPPPPPPPPVVVKAPEPPPPPPAPVVVPKPVAPKPLEVLCPPVNDTTKMSKAEKKTLRDRGCKVRG